jgi:tetratricopeptide (TPR) repeat protein
VGQALASRRDRRLNDWKEIAAFFGRDERTVRRWERQRGLPVHRISGGARNLVFAYTEELEQWLRGDRATPAEAPLLETVPAEPDWMLQAPAADPGQARRMSGFRQPALIIAGAMILFAVIAIAGMVSLRDAPTLPGRAAYRPDPKVQDLYLDAVYYLETRQASGLNRAMQLLTEATTLDPNYADAYAKLADTYNMVSQFTLMPARDAYPKAKAAANRAIALDPDNAGGYAALAFAAFYWDKDFPRSRALFERAIRLDPASAQTHHWYALTLMVAGETERPLNEIGTAQELSPQSRSILANKALILFHAGRVDEALAILQPLAEAEPNLRSPPEYLATIYLDQHRWSDFLREYRLAAVISGNDARRAIADAAEKGLREEGGDGLLKAMFAEQLRQYQRDREPAYKVATTAAMLGRNDEAMRYLEESARRKEDDLLGVRIDPAFRGLRADPRYRAIVETEGFVPAQVTGA